MDKCKKGIKYQEKSVDIRKGVSFLFCRKESEEGEDGHGSKTKKKSAGKL